MSLKLPPNWEGSVDNNSKEEYVLSEENRYYKIPTHPSHNFISYVIQQ